MEEITIKVGKVLFEFQSFQDWVNHTPAKFDQCDELRERILCVDTKGRVCAMGIDFARAKKDKAFPVRAYSVAL